MALSMNLVHLWALLFAFIMKNKETFAEEMFSRTPETSSFVEGEFAYLECMAKNSEIQLSWEKDNQQLFSSGHISIMEGGFLFFNKVRLEDSGKYSCIASNVRTGDTQKSSAKLEILPGYNIEEICGKPKIKKLSNEIMGRLVSGYDSIKGANPWHVLFMKNGRLNCNGVLLNNRWIATTAHCFFSGNQHKKLTNISIILGKYKLNVVEDQELLAHFDDYAPVIVHPFFNSTNYNNDIALVRLKHSVRFTDYIYPICVCDRGLGEMLLSSQSNNYKLKLGTVTGWGYDSFRGKLSETLQEINIPVVNRNNCVLSGNIKMGDGTFCAGYGKAGSQDTCFGDSGSGFTMEYNERWYLLGLASFGEGCAVENKYGYYTKVPNYYEWIKAIISS